MPTRTDVAVLICYRVSDSAEDAGDLHRLLIEKVDPARVWLGIDAVPHGEGFGEGVANAIAQADVVLAIIGTDWLAVDAGGRRLLDDPADPVRLEIEEALANDLPVIPVLVGGARMPRPEELPVQLRALSGRQAYELRGDAFAADVERLAVILTEPEETTAAPKPDLEVSPETPTTPAEADLPLRVDENVQFTVYRPRTLQPGRWSTLLAFAHLSERRLDGDPDEPDPLEEVQRQAEQVLGQDVDSYLDLTQDSSAGVPREGELMFLPTADGVDFNPPSRTFKWLESVHREEFRLRTSGASVGQTLRGRMSVFLGVRLLAEISLQFLVTETPAPAKPAPVVEQARPYRRIFASYSHRDVRIAEQFEHYAAVFGDRYLRDWIDLRAGEKWSERLEELIRQADVFQLFWSWNSIRSENVRREWEYALGLDRPNFVRPTYWEVPMPRDPASGLPPPALNELHFHRLAVDPVGPPPPAGAAAAAAAAAAAPAPAQVEAFPDAMYVPPSPPPAPQSRPDIAARSGVALLIVVALTLLVFVAVFVFSGSPRP